MKTHALLILLCCTAITVKAQVGINTTTPKAQLEIKSSNEATPANTDGLIIPKMATFPAVNPTADQQGMLVYLTTTSGSNLPGFYYWNNPISAWVPVGNNNNTGWNINGNALTNPANHYVGTTDNTDLVLRTNKVEQFRIKNDGRIEIGNKGTNPTYVGATSLSKKLFIASETLTNNFVLQASNPNGDPASMYFGGSTGNILTPQISNTNQNIGNIFFAGYDGAKFMTAAGIYAKLEGPASLNRMPCSLNFQTYSGPDDDYATRMVIRHNGNVGINVPYPSHKLHVIGSIRMEDTNQALGKVLTSDENGVGSWQTLPATADWGISGNAGMTLANFIGTTDEQAFSIRTNNATRARFLATGEVGIGTTAPQQKLHVSGPAGLTAVRIGNTSATGSTSNVALDFFRNSDANTDWRIYNVGPNLSIGNSGDDLDTVNELYQFQAGRFIPMNDASMNLGQTGFRWNTVFASNGIINTSDVRQKKNIQNLSYGLKDLMQLRPVSFEWIKDDGSGSKLGLIAQELQKVIPEVVRDWDWAEDEKGNKTKQPVAALGVYYSDLIPVLIKSVQEQQQLIEQQAKQLAQLAAELEKLKSKK